MKNIAIVLILVFGLVSNTYAIDSEPILKSSLVAIDSEPILKINEVAIDSEPILVDNPKAIDSEPILKEALGGMSVIYKKDGKYIKVTYKADKAEEVDEKEGKKRESKGQVQKLRNSK